MDRLPPGARGRRASSSPTTARPTAAARCSRRWTRRASCGTCPSPTGPGCGRSCRPTRAILAATAAMPTGSPSSTPTSSCCRPPPVRRRAAAGSSHASAPIPSVGAIVVNWALYGSSGHLACRAGAWSSSASPGGPARFRCPTTTSSRSCAPRPAPGSAATRTPSRSPPPFRAVHGDGRDLSPPLGIDGLSREVVWAPLRINHYVVKSREEFMTRKLPRGPGHHRPAMRAPGFFEATTATRSPTRSTRRWPQATRRERDRIAGAGSASGCPPRADFPSDGIVRWLRNREIRDFWSGRPGSAGPGSALVLDQPALVAAQEVGADDEEAAARPPARRG